MVDFMKDSHFFSAEEQVVLNRVAVGIGKDSCCEQLEFGMSVTEDEDCISLFQSVLGKVRGLSVEEWADLQGFLPFFVPSMPGEDFEGAEE